MTSPGRSDRRPADDFERAYAAALLEAKPVDPRERDREAKEGQARAEPGEPFALGGCVLTPDERHDDAWVVVAGGSVAEIGDRRPSGVTTIDTGGIVLPGLIDLHGHPEYNVFAAWEPPKLYANRYQWRDSDEYAAVVKQPWSRLTGKSPKAPSLIRSLTRYAEARALVGGTTAIQGASGTYPDPAESLVRNVDRHIFGQHHGRSIIDLDRATPEALKALRDQIDQGTVRALYIHLAEGIASDERSRGEFKELVDAGLLTPATVIIHGTALGPEELGEVKDAGAKLVWSPQSNLRLYGETTEAAKALSLGIPMGVGADWLPSGSPSLLDELQVVQRELQRQGSRVGAKRLVQLVTTEAARVAALDDRLGSIGVGRPADLVVLERHDEDPWESVVSSDRRSVELVTIGGDITYGRLEWVEQLAGPTEREPVIAWGKRMALDLTYSVMASPDPPPRLVDLRAQLLERHAGIGPIFA